MDAQEHTGQERRHPQGFRATSRRSLYLALAIIGTFFVIEIAGGLLTNSLALLADAGHLLTDIGAILLSLLAIWFAARPITSHQTFGYYRVEIFAALVNGVTLWAVAGYIAYEAYTRIQDPPEVHSLPMLLVATTGFAAQTGAAFILRRGSGESLNVKGAYVHVATDAVQSLGIVVAGGLMLAFGWLIIDPVASLLIALLILWSGGRVAWQAVRVLLEQSPERVDVGALCRRMEGVQGVAGVHDIHAWSITTGYEVFSAHVVLDAGFTGRRETLLRHLRDVASTEFNIGHVTIQLEESEQGCGETHHVEHGPG